jgi:hypothetical protein
MTKRDSIRTDEEKKRLNSMRSEAICSDSESRSQKINTKTDAHASPDVRLKHPRAGKGL